MWKCSVGTSVSILGAERVREASLANVALPKMAGMTEQASPLIRIDEFIAPQPVSSLFASLLQRKRIARHKLEKSCPGNKKLSLQYHRGVFISS